MSHDKDKDDCGDGVYRPPMRPPVKPTPTPAATLGTFEVTVLRELWEIKQLIKDQAAQDDLRTLVSGIRDTRRALESIADAFPPKPTPAPGV